MLEVISRWLPHGGTLGDLSRCPRDVAHLPVGREATALLEAAGPMADYLALVMDGLRRTRRGATADAHYMVTVTCDARSCNLLVAAAGWLPVTPHSRQPWAVVLSGCDPLW